MALAPALRLGEICARSLRGDVLSGRDSVVAAERVRQRALVVEPGGISCFRQRDVAPEAANGGVQSRTQQMRVGRHAGDAIELSDELKRRESHGRGQPIDGKPLAVSVPDGRECAFNKWVDPPLRLRRGAALSACRSNSRPHASSKRSRASIGSPSLSSVRWVSAKAAISAGSRTALVVKPGSVDRPSPCSNGVIATSSR